MKSYIVLLISLISVSNTIAQNPTFYRQHPTNSNIQWYYQINETPVIIKNGNVTSENTQPNWYNAFQFLNCAGVFSNVSQAYTYLTTRSEFLSIDNSYYNRTNPSQQAYYIEPTILNRSRSYSTNEAAKGDANAYVLAGCRESVVFGELYLKINGEEFVFIDYMRMYLFNLNSSSTSDINSVVSYLKADMESEVISKGLRYAIFHKENGIWKYVIEEKADAYISNIESNFDFLNGSNGKPVIHVESRVNSSGNRVYQQL